MIGQWHEFQLNSTGTQASMVVEDSPWVTVRLTDDAQVQSALSDPEEVEHSMLWHGLELVVRHTLSQWWTIRWMLHNPGSTPVSVPDLAVRFDLSPETCGWTWAAGDTGTVLVAPVYQAGPVLAWSVTLGCLRRVGKKLIVTPPGLVLPAGGRYVSSWRGSRYPSTAAAGAEIPKWVGPQELAGGGVLAIPKPNAVIRAASSITVTEVTDGERRLGYELTGPPGEVEVEVVSGNSATALKPCWAPDFDSLVARIGTVLLAESRKPTGAESLVLQYGLGQHVFSDPGLVERRLQTVWEETRKDDWGQLDVAAAAVAALNQGDSAGAAEAIRRCALLDVTLGYGQVATRVWLATASLDSGSGWAQAAESLFRRDVGTKPGLTELALLTNGDSVTNQLAIQGVVNRLGAELPGYPWALGRVRRAKMVGVLTNYPQGTPLMAQTVTKTIRRLTAMIWDGRAQPKDVETLAWLILARN